jgi:transposase
MFIKAVKKWRQGDDGLGYPYQYYRLCESYRNENGKACRRMVIGLGELTELPLEQDRTALAELLTLMIEKGEYVMSENPIVYEKALEVYNTYRRERAELLHAAEQRLAEEVRRKEEDRQHQLVTIRLDSLRQVEARQVGAEHVCRSTLKQLGIAHFLRSKGWSRERTDIAQMQILSRAIYPYSELKTVSYLRENSALCEMFHISPDSITKDVLYRSAKDLYSIHRELEDYLHERVCNLFHLEDKILLFDLTNTYFEGRMEGSSLCRFGRSKEKRSDCKIVVLAAVVNTQGLLVRTEIFEGNRADVTTLQEVIGSLQKGLPHTRKLIVMDSGFSSDANITWLKENGYHYITVMRSAGISYTPQSEIIQTVHDNRDRQIRLQLVHVEGLSDTVLLVESDGKALKETSMYRKASHRYEEGLKAIQAGISGKGVKLRDRVNERIGRLKAKYPSVHKAYAIEVIYDKKDRAVSMEWTRDETLTEEKRKLHGKYFLQTNLDESQETNIWKFYNVIRTVEETFKTLKTDLDIRPVYHKTDQGATAHLNLAVLAYWIVSTTQYKLKTKGIHLRWGELIRIMSTQVRVTAQMEQQDGRRISVRQSTLPEEKLGEIYHILELTECPLGKLKSVGHPKHPPRKNDS